MNNFEKSSYGLAGIICIISGGSSLGLSALDKLIKYKKVLQIIGVLLTGIGMITSALFVDANLYPEIDNEEITEE